MEAEATVAKGATALYLASVITLILNTAYFVILTNFLTTDEVGLASLLNIVVIGTATLATLALPLSGSGLGATPPAVTRFLSQYIREGVGSARKLFLFSLGLCSLVSSAVALAMTSPPLASKLAAPLSPTPVFYAGLDAVVFSLAQLGVYSVIGAGRSPLGGRLLVISSFLRYGAASALLLQGYGIPGVFAGFTLGDLSLALAANFFAVREMKGSKDGALDFRLLAGYMASVMVAAFIGFGVAQVDKLLAFFQRGFSNLGVYNVASVGAAIAAFAPAAVTNVMVPALGLLKTDDAPRRRELMKNYTRYIVLVAAPMGIGLSAISPFLLRLFGDQYLVAALLIAVIATSVAFTSVGSVYAADLLASSDAYLFSVGNVLGLTILVALALALVPIFGLLGVALARSAMLILTLLSFAVFVRRRGDLVLDASALAKSGLASSVMGVITYTILYATTNFLLTGRALTVLASVFMIPVGFFIYLYLMKLLRAFGASDLQFLRMLLPRPLRWIAEFAKLFL